MGLDRYAAIDAREGVEQSLVDAKKALKRLVRGLRAEASEATLTAREFKGNYYELCGGVFQYERSILDIFKIKLHRKREGKLRVLRTEKKPTDNKRYVGIEIEFFSATHDDTEIMAALADADLETYCNLTTDGSVRGDNDNGGGECAGSCRENCECYTCGEPHYCDNSNDCARACRNNGSVVDRQNRRGAWEFRDDCTDCTETESLDDCDCGGNDSDTGAPQCLGNHIICDGHCPGHYCQGYDDHDGNECSCECDCNGGTNEGLELRVCVPQIDHETVVNKVCKVLASCGAEVNKTCGLHVHLDMRGRDVARSYVNLVAMQNILYRMVPATRKNNDYCKPNTARTWVEREGSRYQGINHNAYTEHKTLEIRIHSGTVNAKKINAWIALLIATIRTKELKAIPSNPKHALKLIKATPELARYVHERLDQFKSDHERAA